METAIKLPITEVVLDGGAIIGNSVTAINSVFHENECEKPDPLARGGAIPSYGTVEAVGSLFSDNVAATHGSAIFAEIVQLYNSILWGNEFTETTKAVRFTQGFSNAAATGGARAPNLVEQGTTSFQGAPGASSPRYRRPCSIHPHSRSPVC